MEGKMAAGGAKWFLAPFLRSSIDGEQMERYPLFKPPKDLATRDRVTWTNSEADQYREWLISSMDGRITQLLRYFKIAKRNELSSLLPLLGRKAKSKLKSRDFSRRSDDGLELTDRGYALAADLGLLVANLLLKSANGKIYWSTIRKPKSDASYNLPVLSGLASNLDPIEVSIAEAYGVLEGERDENAWQELYNECHQEIIRLNNQKVSTPRKRKPN